MDKRDFELSSFPAEREIVVDAGYLPLRFKQLVGTVVVTSVGMFGNRGGWGIGFLPTHNLGITAGGISQKPRINQGEICAREMLDLTISFDHDIIDGAPAARFANTLSDYIETGIVFDTIEDGENGV